MFLGLVSFILFGSLRFLQNLSREVPNLIEATKARSCFVVLEHGEGYKVFIRCMAQLLTASLQVVHKK